MGRIPRVAKRKYQVQHLWDKHHYVKRLALLGFTNKMIAQELGCTPENICAIRGSELFKREMQAANLAADCASVDVAAAIREIGPKSLMLLDNILENNIDVLGEHSPISLRANVAQNLLDRNPKTAKVKMVDGEIRHGHVVVDATIARIKDRAKEIEAEFEVIEQEQQQASA